MSTPRCVRYPLVLSFIDFVLSELLLVLLSVAMLVACRDGNGDSKFPGAIFNGVIAGAGAGDANFRGSLFDYYLAYNFAGGRGGKLPAFLDVLTGNGHYLADSFHMLYLTSLLPGLSILLLGLTLVRRDFYPVAREH